MKNYIWDSTLTECQSSVSSDPRYEPGRWCKPLLDPMLETSPTRQHPRVGHTSLFHKTTGKHLEILTKHKNVTWCSGNTLKVLNHNCGKFDGKNKGIWGNYWEQKWYMPNFQWGLLKAQHSPRGMPLSIVSSISLLNFAVISDAINPGATAFTCRQAKVKQDQLASGSN